MNNFTFGQFYPADSFVHKMDARFKIFLSLLYVVFIFFVNSYFGYAVTAAFILLVVAVSKVPLRVVFKSIKGILILVVFTSLLNLFFVDEGEVIFKFWIVDITDKAVNFTIMMALRLVLLVLGTSVLTLTTTPTDLTDGLESLLSPLKLVKFPVHDVAIIMSIALRFIPTLMDETQRIINAQKARGADFDTGNVFKRAKAMIPVLVPMFVSAFRRADELAFALDARCYNATENRTKMKKPHVTYRDFVGTFVTIGYVVVILLDSYVWLGVF